MTPMTPSSGAHHMWASGFSPERAEWRERGLGKSQLTGFHVFESGFPESGLFVRTLTFAWFIWHRCVLS